MKKIYSSLILLFSVLMVFGQLDTTISITFTETAPVIDGIIDELWEDIDEVPLEQTIGEEAPTVTAYWKAVWDDDNFYVLVSVEDDDHYPSWVSGGGWYDFDQPEIYFDLNAELKDGVGASGGLGHWQIQPHFVEGGSGLVSTNTDNVSAFRPECNYCYVITGESYVWEYELPYDEFTNKDGSILSVVDFLELEKIGFDVTVIDQDENVTSSRQRAVWSNVGGTDENYTNMDDAGTIVLKESTVGIGNSRNVISTLSVYPNPVIDYMTVNMDFDRLEISNLLGQSVWTFENSSKRVNLEMLPEGVYFIQAFENGQSIGVSKFLKK